MIAATYLGDENSKLIRHFRPRKGSGHENALRATICSRHREPPRAEAWRFSLDAMAPDDRIIYYDAISLTGPAFPITPHDARPLPGSLSL